jgi:hypothetical protein
MAAREPPLQDVLLQIAAYGLNYLVMVQNSLAMKRGGLHALAR